MKNDWKTALGLGVIALMTVIAVIAGDITLVKETSSLWLFLVTAIVMLVCGFIIEAAARFALFPLALLPIFLVAAVYPVNVVFAADFLAVMCFALWADYKRR